MAEKETDDSVSGNTGFPAWAKLMEVIGFQILYIPAGILRISAGSRDFDG